MSLISPHVKQVVSACCHREIISGTKMEYPDGGTRWGISYTVEVCRGCGKEVQDYAMKCEGCGKVECDGVQCES